MSIEWIKKISRVKNNKTERKTTGRTSAVTAWNLGATCSRISELPLLRRLEMATIAIMLWQCVDGIMSCWRMGLISLRIRRAAMQETNQQRQQAAVWGCKHKTVLNGRTVAFKESWLLVVAIFTTFQSWLFTTILYARIVLKCKLGD